METPIEWTNYIRPTKNSSLSSGHIKAEELLGVIRNRGPVEGYHCMYDLDKRDGYAVYEGPTRPALGVLIYDFDSEDDVSISMKDTKAFVEWLDVPCEIFFTGGKGFHVYVSQNAFDSPEKCTPAYQKDLVQYLKNSYPTLDTVIYHANRKMRIPGSRHDKTGLFKIPVQLSELTPEGLELIKQRAKTKPDMSQWSPIEAPQLSTKLNLPLDTHYKPRSPVKATEAGAGAQEEDYSQFEKFEEKKCIQKMIERVCPEGSRHETMLIILNDLFNTGTHPDDARKLIHKWATRQGIEGRADVESTFEKVFFSPDRAPYSYGCNHPAKYSLCTAKCAIWKTLKNKPKVIDIPAYERDRQQKENELSEKECAEQLIIEGRGDFVKQQGCIFHYEGGRWVEVLDERVDEIKRRIVEIHDNSIDSHKMESVYRMFKTFVKPPEDPTVDLFAPCRTKVNFKNKTISVDIKTGAYTAYDHMKTDYLTNILPYNFEEAPTENPRFRQVLDEVFKGDEDKDSKLLACQHWLGACLFPHFPRFFYFYGEPQTGKSTMLMIGERLVAEGNCSGIQPSEFNGFLMEPMIGKLVNIVTDIDHTRPMNEARVKQIVDKKKLVIQRKGKLNVLAPLPYVHGFGGNYLLTTEQGSGLGLMRRWSVVHFKNKFPIQDSFVDWIFEAGAGDIIKWALDGFIDLIKKGGAYEAPSTGKDILEQSIRSNDPVSIVEDYLKEDMFPGYTWTGVVTDKVRSKNFTEAVRDFMMKQRGLTKVMDPRSVVGELVKRGVIARDRSKTERLLSGISALNDGAMH